jgi:hypothetical protein
VTADAVVVRWRGGDEVARCLRALLDHGGTALGRVVLVDSGSGDGGAERLAADFPTVRVVALPENRSFAWAADQGVAAGDAPLVLLLNPDTEVVAGAVDALVAFVAERPGAAGVVPLLEGPDGAPQHRWQLRRLPGAFRLAGGRPGRPQLLEPPTVPVPVEQPAAAAWLVRRAVWEALGGLDPAFAPAWWEDVDFCARLRRRAGTPGFPATEGFWVVPEARVLHAGASSVASLGEGPFLAAYHRNLLRYVRGHHPRVAGCVAAGLRLSLAAKVVVKPGRRGAYLGALRAISGTGTGTGGDESRRGYVHGGEG